MKKIVSALVAVLMLGLAAVGFAEAGDGSVSIGLIMPAMESTYCQQIVAAAEAVGQREGFTVITSDSAGSPENEISGLENLVNSGCKAVGICSMNPVGLVDATKAAQEAGVGVFTWSAGVKNYDAQLIEDVTLQAEVMVASMQDWMDAKLGGTAEIALIYLADANNPDSNAGIGRAAFDAEIEKTLVSGGSQVVNTQFAKDSTDAMAAAENIMSANPDVRMIFCQSDAMAISVIEAVEGMGMGSEDFYVSGLDGTQEALQRIADGSVLRAVVFNDTTQLGASIGEALYALATTGTGEDVIAQYTLVDSTNVGEYVQ